MAVDVTNEFGWLPSRALQFGLYLALRGAAAAAAMFPYSAAGAWGRAVGAVGRWVDRKHRRLAAENLRKSGLDPGLVPRVYGHLGRVAVEAILARRAVRHVRLEGTEILDRELARGRGVIAVTGHLGNWELAGQAIARAGYPFTSLARPVRNPHFRRWMTELRAPQRIVFAEQPVRAMLEVLRRGEVVAMLADQDAREGGVVVEFFGRPASTVRTPGLLSLRTGAPIVPFNIWRDGERHFVRFTEPVEGENVASITQAFTSRIESFVRERPEQWLWLHRRWKSVERGQVPVS
jgi:KDO2-lipid IV(A) lauroyltransferase